MQKLDIQRDVEKIIEHVKDGSVFVYPTDTIYGIGCNALEPESVERIRKIKKSKKPFSVIAPSKTWIKENLEMRQMEYLEKLPGPYTLVLKKKQNFLNHVSDNNNLGVRIPEHPFTSIIQKAGVPFVTTSVNVTGKSPITSVDGVPKEILNKIDFLVDSGVLDNKPSTIIDLTSEPRIIR
ncbi:MAG: L-threonylcarbamoyladenylate synthase [Candidatus Aenigmatarchaeota archaeon]